LSSAIAVYLVVIAAILGFGKEQTRLGLWSGRLTVDRDISLEMELRRIGPQIAGDVFISSLSVLDNAESAIVNLLTDKYMSRLVQ
ncbi:hypothetical protein, partial [Klebsiella pneumoniae]|uniref:hypothetical protein n=1 Tax=Klebsiella pneumoniae TaxID=573 RepID=UPI001CC1D981